jgi:hypothetical protein
MPPPSATAQNEVPASFCVMLSGRQDNRENAQTARAAHGIHVHARYGDNIRDGNGTFQCPKPEWWWTMFRNAARLSLHVIGKRHRRKGVQRRRQTRQGRAGRLAANRTPRAAAAQAHSGESVVRAHTRRRIRRRHRDRGNDAASYSGKQLYRDGRSFGMFKCHATVTRIRRRFPAQVSSTESRTSA